MILTNLGLGSTAFRAHTPKWSFAPTSGAGAARGGGRFNRPGIEALYLSLDEVTALREYQQTSPLLPPSMLCSYVVVLSELVDLRQLGKGPPWDDLWQDWTSDWRHLHFNLHIEPPTWVLSDMVRDAGHPGIIFPSVANPGGMNIVVYPDLFSPADQVDVVDPEHLLPKNPDSWPA